MTRLIVSSSFASAISDNTRNRPTRRGINPNDPVPALVASSPSTSDSEDEDVVQHPPIRPKRHFSPILVEDASDDEDDMVDSLPLDFSPIELFPSELDSPAAPTPVPVAASEDSCMGVILFLLPLSLTILTRILSLLH